MSKPWEERLCLEIKIRMGDDWNVMDFCKHFTVLPKHKPSIFRSMDLKGLWCNWGPAMWISCVHSWDSGCLDQDIYSHFCFNTCFEDGICSNTIDMSENHLSIMQIFISSTRNFRWKQKTATFWPKFVVRNKKQVWTEAKRDFIWTVYCKERMGASYSCSMEKHPPWGLRFRKKFSSVCISHSVVSNSLWPLGSRQAPVSMGFSRQEYWNGLPFPFPGIKPWSPALQTDSLPSEPSEKPLYGSK